MSLRELTLALLLIFAISSCKAANMVCFYDSASFLRPGQAQLTLPKLELALQFCNTLVYGYAGIEPSNHEIRPLKELDAKLNHYLAVTELKRKHPQVRMLLSVGGDHDIVDDPSSSAGNQYLNLLEESTHRQAFIRSVINLLRLHNFDGLDLSWQFPKTPSKNANSGFKKAWNKFKGWFGSRPTVDEKAEEHKTQFTSLVRELKEAFRQSGHILSLTMLPHVDAALFIDIPAVMPYLNFVNLGSFDFQTPLRDAKIADMPAPLYEMFERPAENNINFQVDYWLNNTAPSNKINIGVPAYGLSWIMTRDSGITGYPPIPEANGPAPGGRLTNTPGLLSWPEICEMLHKTKEFSDAADAPLKKVGDPRQRYGTYGYRAADEHGEYGIWVGYEEPATASIKASFVYAKALGGVALFDLSMDDFQGDCAGEVFPILRSIKNKL